MVFPTPRAPENMYACATRSFSIAFSSVSGHMLLSDQIVERLRAPLARYYLVAHVLEITPVVGRNHFGIKERNFG